jgi:acetate CoA/acetoacetate CoA-transferase alpha subunit
MTLMVGGFMAIGTAETMMDALVARGVRDLTIIANDCGYPDKGIGKLVSAKLVKKCIVSHIGLNPEAGRQMMAGEMAIDLVPQGTLVEQIRAYGAGLGGVLTATGLGTDVAKGKQVVTVDGKDYLLERPLKADVAIVRASVADTNGNVTYAGTTRNFNPIIAMAAHWVIVEAETVVPVGGLDPDHIVTPGLLVDMVVKEGGA